MASDAFAAHETANGSEQKRNQRAAGYVSRSDLCNLPAAIDRGPGRVGHA